MIYLDLFDYLLTATIWLLCLIKRVLNKEKQTGIIMKIKAPTVASFTIILCCKFVQRKLQILCMLRESRVYAKLAWWHIQTKTKNAPNIGN